MAQPIEITRLLRRVDIRNLSYIELLLIVVFTALLLFSFSRIDLAGEKKKNSALENIVQTEKAKLASSKAENDRANKELSDLRPLADPQTRSRLRNVGSLKAQEKQLFDKVVKLSAELRRLEATSRNRKQLEANIARLTEQMRRLRGSNRDQNQLKAEVARLTEQLRDSKERAKYLDRQNKSLTASGTGNTFGRRPCWIADGRAVKTFDIFITDRGFRVVPDWPADFIAKAGSVPEILNLSSNRNLSDLQFSRLAKALDQRGRGANCVYYARARNGARALSLKDYDARQKLIGQYFYPI
jgi:hypothetical protein